MRLNLFWLWITLALCALAVSCAHDTEWLSRMEYDILATDTDNDFFLIEGNHAAEFKVEGEIEVKTADELGNTLTLGPFTVSGVVPTNNGTRILIEGNVPDEDLVGAIIVHVSDANQEPDPEAIQIEFSTRGPFTPEVWYFLAFNFSRSRGVTVDSLNSPEPQISGENRGKNWEMYVMIHQDEGGATELRTLQTTRVPSVMSTGRVPVDTTTGQLNEDNLIDVAIACQADNIVHILPAEEPAWDDPLNDIKYWDLSEPVNGSSGASPIRVHADDLTGDGIDDLLILYAGSSAGDGFMRVLAGEDTNSDTNHDGTFVQLGGDINLGNTPVDWVAYDFTADKILDLNDDTFADVVVLGATETAGQVMVFHGVDGGGFAAPETVSTAAQPVAIAAGVLTEDSIDFAVASNSGAGGNGVVQVLQAQAGAGHVSVHSLELDGPVESVAIAKMFGAVNDIAATYNTADEGNVAIFHNEENEFFTGGADVFSYNGAAYGLLPVDSSSDNYVDLVVTDGVPGRDNHSMFIIQRDGSKPTSFNLDQDVITYLMGSSPGRIHRTDLDGDGLRDDFVIPNSLDDTQVGGNSVNLVYGQGKSNYTNADRYWVDAQPGYLTDQPWYQSHALGPNSFSLVIDPLVFYDLTLTEVDSFVIDIMTAESAIDFENNIVDGVRQDSEVREHMSKPIGVNVTVDYLNDENNANRTLEEPADPAEDIDFWKIEVI